MKKLTCIILSVILILSGNVYALEDGDMVNTKPVLIITTDIGGGDVDDQQSMVRLLVYANEFDIKGIIPGSSMVDEGTTGEADLYACYEAYEKVYPNLIKHDPSFPTKEYLYSVTKIGNPRYGEDYVGQGHDTDGSNHIIAVVDEILENNDPRPVNISAWGGTTDIAQALWKVSNTRTEEEAEAFFAKLRLNVIADQDSACQWIQQNYPQVFYIRDRNVSDGQKSVFRGMYIDGDQSLTSLSWLNTYVNKNHGELGAIYPTEAWTGVNPNSCIKEGDTPSWFYFLDNGLHYPDHPEYGGWGGRFKKSGTFYVDATDTACGLTNSRVTVARWRPDFQADFAARMDWCVSEYADANHAPVAKLNHANELTVAPGDTVKLDASLCTDPDGDSLTYKWWQYNEPGTYQGSVSITDAAKAQASFVAPGVSEPQTIHLILEVTDNGTPALKGYQRVIVTVNPALAEMGGFNSVITSDFNYIAGQEKEVGYTIVNNSGKDEKIVAVVAQYNDDNRLNDVDLSVDTINNSQTKNLSVKAVINADASLVKTFAFKEVDLSPVTKCSQVKMHNGNASANGLVGYWQFNEGSGTSVQDSSSYAKTISSTVAWAEGYDGSGISFDGDDYITVGTDEQYNITGAISLSMWIYVPEYTSGRVVCKQGSKGKRGWSLNIEETGKASFQIAKDKDNLYLVDSVSDVPLNQWVHIAGVYIPGKSCSIYINGKLDNQRTDSVPSSQYNNSLALTLGARPSKECYFKGIADEICIYNRPLTQEEIAYMAN